MSKFNDKVLSELVSKQLKKVDNNKKFDYQDIKRLSKYVPDSIFQTDKCVLWTGYITNKDNFEKGVYINFYFRNKKYALHRLLYLNFIGNLYDDEYLRFTCENKGCCCNINHLSKIEKNNKITQTTNLMINENNKISKNNENKTQTNSSDNKSDDFIVDFD